MIRLFLFLARSVMVNEIRSILLAFPAPNHEDSSYHYIGKVRQMHPYDYVKSDKGYSPVSSIRSPLFIHDIACFPPPQMKTGNKASAENHYTFRKWLWLSSFALVWGAAVWVGNEMHYSQERNDRTIECLTHTKEVLEVLEMCASRTTALCPK